VERHRLAAAVRRAAARREARRRAAARRAAERAAARQARQSAGSSASTPAAPSGSPQQIAAAMLGSFGWSSGEFGCLQSLWNAESGWNPSATNPISGAYGIPQALPGSKMASAGPDWQTNPATQIKWGLGYIQQVYGSPCAAWSHQQSTGWY
jgi:Transglycosylase SLT domain